MHFHSTYLQKRQQGVSYREFQRLWRSHGDFAANVPAFWNAVERYIHNDPVEDTSGLPNVTSSYDAVGELYYTSHQAWTSMRDVMWNEVAPDEKRVFAGAPLSVRGERRVCQQPGGHFKLFTFAKFRETRSSEEIAHLIEAHIKDTVQSSTFGGALTGFTITTALRSPLGLAMDTVPQTASSHDLLFIHYFDSEVAARRALRSVDYARLQLSENGFMDWDSRIILLCRAWILKGGLG